MLKSFWNNGSLVVYPPTLIGTSFYVDATNGATGNSGLNWDNALTTIDAAINKCTANKGDVIYVAPWHAENLIAATTINMDTEGVTIIGLSDGNRRPTLTITVAAGAITVSGANCRISNLEFLSACVDAGTTGAITTADTADGLQVDNCVFRDGGTNILEMAYGIVIAAACDNCKILNNRFYTTAAGSGTLTGISLTGETARTIIANNVMLGDWNTAAIGGSTALATKITIYGNVINNLDATTGFACNLHANTTGTVVRNLAHGGLNATAPISAAGCLMCENYQTNAEAASGLLLPAAGDWAA